MEVKEGAEKILWKEREDVQNDQSMTNKGEARRGQRMGWWQGPNLVNQGWELGFELGNTWE